MNKKEALLGFLFSLVIFLFFFGAMIEIMEVFAFGFISVFAYLTFIMTMLYVLFANYVCFERLMKD